MTETVESDAVLAKILAEEEAANYGSFVDSDKLYDSRGMSRKGRKSSSDDEDEDFVPGKYKSSKNRNKTNGMNTAEKKKKSVFAREQSIVETGGQRDEEKKRKAPSKWTEEEEKRFLEALNLFGRDWQKCAEYMGTRDANNFRSHAQKYFIRLYKQGLPVPPKVAESGQGHTLSGKPLDPNSAAARCYIFGKEYRKELASKRTSSSQSKAVEKENQIFNIQEPSSNEVDEVEAQMLMDLEMSPIEEPARTCEENDQVANHPKKAKKTKSVLQVCEEGVSSSVMDYDEEETREYPSDVSPEREGSQPFHLQVDNIALIIMDFHSHLTQVEIIGFLGGYWKPEEKKIIVLEAFPCRSLSHSHSEDDRYFSVEMDPESEVEIRKDIEERGLRVVGWYHSHPTFRPNPSLRDLTNQQSYQTLFRDHRNNIEPFVGAIVSPYDARLVKDKSIIHWFYCDQSEAYILSCSPFATPSSDSTFIWSLLEQRLSRCLQDVQQTCPKKMIHFDDIWRHSHSSGQDTVSFGSFRDKLKFSLQAKRPICVGDIEFDAFLEETLSKLLPQEDKEEKV
ncbi:NADH-cytochrome b5 reductase 1 [Galdieria sulphuraria]|nr:NADH-cytochrome b5 reductase 1 [Galdieria sulphuraria]